MKLLKNLTPRLGANYDGAKVMQVGVKKKQYKWLRNSFIGRLDEILVLPKRHICSKICIVVLAKNEFCLQENQM
jgi:hypothetical protein